MQKEVVFYNRHGEKLAGVLHLPRPFRKAPLIILCHGLGTSKDSTKSLAEQLESRGFASLRFDFSGCGESEGDFRKATIEMHLEDLDSAVRFAEELGASKLYLVGYCHGGMLSAIYAAENEVAGLALISGVFSYQDIELLLKSVKFAGYWMHRRYAQKTRRNMRLCNYVSTMHYGMGEIIRKVKCPVLVIHGSKDSLVPMGHAFRYYDNASSSKKLQIIEGASHFFAKIHDAETAEKIEVWIKSASNGL